MATATIFDDGISVQVASSRPVSKALSIRLWNQALAQIGERRFDVALKEAIKASPFFPHVSEILKFAGQPVEVPSEREAREALHAIFAAIRAHADALIRLNATSKEELHVSVALKLKALRGEILYDHRSGPEETARFVDPPVRGPGVPAPVFSQVTEAALVEVGYGDRAEGLASLAEHPTLAKLWPKGQEPPTLGFREKNARDIEHRWLQAYTRCRAEHLAGK